jgi:hypothetical protein
MVQKLVKNFVASVVFCLLCSHVVAQHNIPLIGSAITVQTTVCKIDLTSKGKHTINHVYSSPGGWQILAFKQVVIADTEKASYAFSPTPVRFAISSTSVIYSKFIELFELAAEKNVFEKYHVKITEMRTDFERYIENDIPLYSSIKTTGAIKKNNHARSKTARLYVDLMITVVYMPRTEEGVLQSLEYLKQQILAED